jgi:hypothetical protein
MEVVMAKRRPSTSRRAFLKAAAVAPAALLPAVAAAESSQSSPLGAWQPTELGRDVIRQLPPFLEAATRRAGMVDCERAAGFDPDALAAAEEAEDRTSDAYYRPVRAVLEAAEADPAEHLGDLVIVAHCCDDGEGSQNSSRDRAVAMLLDHLLALGGVPADACDQVLIARRIERKVASEGAPFGVVVPFRPRGRVA